MGISYVGADIAHRSAAQAADITLTVPGAGLALLYARGNGQSVVPSLTLTDPSGWTAVGPFTYTNGRTRVEAYWWKVIDADEPDPVVQSSEVVERSASLHVFAGVDLVSPLDATPVASSGTNDETPDCPPITTATDAAAVIVQHGATHDDITAPGAPAGFTLGAHVDGATNDDRHQFTAFNLNAGDAGIVSPGAWTHTNNDAGVSDYSLMVWALRAATATTPSASASAHNPTASVAETNSVGFAGMMAAMRATDESNAAARLRGPDRCPISAHPLVTDSDGSRVCPFCHWRFGP